MKLLAALALAAFPFALPVLSIPAPSSDGVQLVPGTTPRSAELTMAGRDLEKRFDVARIKLFRTYTCSNTVALVTSIDSGFVGKTFDLPDAGKGVEYAAGVLDSIAPGCQILLCYTGRSGCDVGQVLDNPSVCRLASQNGQRKSWNKGRLIC